MDWASGSECCPLGTWFAREGEFSPLPLLPASMQALSLLRLLRRLCRYRVPTEPAFHDTYNFDPDADLTLFYPLIGFGSLSALQSQWLSRSDCSAFNSYGHFAEDLAMQIRCNGLHDVPSGTFLVAEHNVRTYFSPVSMQKRYCMPKFQITVEDALSKPPLFAEALTDTSHKTSWNYDDLLASANQRAEENVELKYRQLNMRSLVYVTSSHDSRFPPGVYRMLELPVFSNQKCREMPAVDCASFGFFIHNQFQPLRDGGGPAEDYYTGRQIVPRLRCRAEMQSATGVDCEQEPYINLPGCSQTNLVLGSAPELYSSQHWLGLLNAPPPPPPGHPPSPPPPGPSPSPLPPPPLAPLPLSQTVVMARLRAAEEMACASVYFRTTADRCDTLAVALSERVLWTGAPPPIPPPALPNENSPPPPPPPPSPVVPVGLHTTPCRSVTLSTMRIPNIYTKRAESGELVNDGYMFPPAVRLYTDTYHEAPFDQRARCVNALRSNSTAQLPCVSGVVSETCLDGGRRCGDVESNGRDPYLSLTLLGKPADRGRYLWGLRIRLPETLELANLFFSADTGDASGYKILLFDEHGAPIEAETAPVLEVTVPKDRELLIQTAAGSASDSEIFRLGDVSYVRLLLPGEYRQIWLKWVEPLERDFSSVVDLVPRPPFPPPRPLQPPAAPAQPTGVCTFHSKNFIPDSFVISRFDEPCALDEQRCCDHALAVKTDRSLSQTVAFHLSDGGCCIVIHASAPVFVPVTSRPNFATELAGVGLLAA